LALTHRRALHRLAWSPSATRKEAWLSALAPPAKARSLGNFLCYLQTADEARIGIVEPSNPRTVEILKSVRTEEVFLVIANIPIQAVLPASDIERARSWYSEKLGLEPVSTNPFGDLRYEAGGVQFLVYQSELAGTNQATAAGFRLENFDEVVAFLRSNGVAFEHVDFGEMGATVDGVITTPDGQKAAWFKDSEGNTFALSMAD
jgi:catechol 2,3-dioxygenase-like lactoylglutathione lyase family enzyme